MKKLGFIGMGNMASAILLGAVKSGFLKGEETVAYDTNAFKLDKLNKECGMAKAGSVQEVIENSEIILLAIKPKIVEGVLSESVKHSRARPSCPLPRAGSTADFAVWSTRPRTSVPSCRTHRQGRCGYDHHRGDKRFDTERVDLYPQTVQESWRG